MHQVFLYYLFIAQKHLTGILLGAYFWYIGYIIVMFVEWKIETVVAFRFIRPVSNTYQEQEQQPYAHDMVKL